MDNKNNQYAIGIDFGTDTVRALIFDVKTGQEVSSEVAPYPRWQNSLYCEPTKNQFRQHPLDYIKSMQEAILESLKKAGNDVAEGIVGIGVDTTGSTPCPVDWYGKPLALLQEFEDNPNAMFHLWKDHTAIEEAKEINKINRESKEKYLK